MILKIEYFKVRQGGAILYDLVKRWINHLNPLALNGLIDN